jgi:fatty-acid desaturase
MPTPPADSSPPHADPFPSSEPTHRAFNWRSAVRSLEWPNLLGILALHLGALFALEYWSWGAVLGSVFLWWLFGGVGICLGYHRLLTHRSFACPKWLEYGLTVLGAMNWEATPLRWVGQHRLHHAESDLPADPHTPHHGLLWSHLLWMFWKDPPELDSLRLTKDLLRDPVHRWIDRWSRAFNLLFAGAVFLAAESLGADGVTWVVWCVCVRGVVIFHATWSVNSLGHAVGYRNYETPDDSTNNLFVALLSFGEGWHNNHHADQRSARHGHRWFEVDLTYSLIRLLGRLGLVWNIREPRRDRA